MGVREAKGEHGCMKQCLCRVLLRSSTCSLSGQQSGHDALEPEMSNWVMELEPCTTEPGSVVSPEMVIMFTITGTVTDPKKGRILSY